jgi:methionine-rich copper-binding protein CopC
LPDRPGSALALVPRVLAAALVLLAWVGIAASPAAAHAALATSSPADGATLTAAPTSVELTFDEPLLEDTETVSINDIDGNVVASQQVKPTGTTVSVPWPADLTTGTFQVAYRVVSGDGHPVMGAITFTIAPAEVSSPSTAPSAAPSTGGSPTASAPAPASSSPATSPANQAPSGFAALVGIAALSAIAVALVVALRRRQ